MKFRTKQKFHANATFVTDNKIKQSSTLSMNVHRTYKSCREMAQHCQYQNGCYFSHTTVPLEKVHCYQCGEEFSSKNVMKAHRKIHWVAECRNFINNQCNVNEKLLVATCKQGTGCSGGSGNLTPTNSGIVANARSGGSSKGGEHKKHNLGGDAAENGLRTNEIQKVLNIQYL